MKRWMTPPPDAAHTDVLLRLTLIELLLRPAGPWGVRALILILAGTGLIAIPVLRAPLTWLVLSLLLGARIVADWPLPDNHIYLLAYWCLGIALVFRFSDSQKVLATTSRLLIGFAFALATLWKSVLSSDYLDGRFFRVTLLTDDRFAGAVMLLTGLSEDQLQQNRDYLQPLPDGAELLDPPYLAEPRAFRWLAASATYGILALEAAIAVLNLLPGADRLQRARHIPLLAFCLVTYAFAPVAGFGWLLLVMGLAQCCPEQRVLRLAYILMYFLVLLFSEIPWAALLAQSS